MSIILTSGEPEDKIQNQVVRSNLELVDVRAAGFICSDARPLVRAPEVLDAPRLDRR
jgi:hypothetical protein